MKLRLESDFTDYYDYMFDRDGTPFRRLPSDAPPRPTMLRYLQRLGHRVPRHGVVKELVPQLPSGAQVVVYLDEDAHRGEGKLKLSREQAMGEYPGCYASEYVGSGNAVTWSHLQIGARSWWLEYVSWSDWRSNQGECCVKVLHEEAPGYHPQIKAPLFAIDFLRDDAYIYAIDFNVAPALAHTGLPSLLYPGEAVKLIKHAISDAITGRNRVPGIGVGA